MAGRTEVIRLSVDIRLTLASVHTDRKKVGGCLGLPTTLSIRTIYTLQKGVNGKSAG